MSKTLPLQDMHLRHFGLTPAIAANNTEAACVCLSRHHTSPTKFVVESDRKLNAVDVGWTAPDARTLGAWNNRTDATEMGTYACVIAAVELFQDRYAVRRAETGTGADYYIGPAGSGVEDLEDCYRLEVSGIDSCSEADVHQRVSQKVKQVRNGKGHLPGVAGVVGYSVRKIAIVTVESAT